MNGIVKYQELAEALAQKIQNRVYPVGERLPTVRDLMAAHKVSLATVRSALEALEQRGMVSRQQGRGTYVTGTGVDSGQVLNPYGASPMPQAESMKGLRLAIATSFLAPERFPQNNYVRIIRGAENAVSIGGGSVALLRLPPKSCESGEALLEQILAASPQMVLGVGGSWCGDNIDFVGSALRRQQIPLVLTYCGGEEGAPVHSVNIDGAAGTRLAVQHLQELGHQRIAFLGLEGETWSRERLLAFTAAAGTAASQIITPGDRGESAQKDLLQALRQSTALVAVNDAYAAWALRAARKHNLDAPRDFSLTGFDDDYQFRDLDLTTVGLPLEELAVVAVRLGHRLLTDDAGGDQLHHVKLRPRLIMRNTTGPMR